jgi:hypothetical protein
MPTEAAIIAGVAVKLRKCACGLSVFEAHHYGAGEGVIFDLEPSDVMEMVASNDALFYRPVATPTFARHVCPIFTDD